MHSVRTDEMIFCCFRASA